MSPKEEGPKEPPKDSILVFSLKSLMREENISLEEAEKRFMEQIEKSPGGGVEHVEPLKKAVEIIKLQQGKK